MDDVTGNSSASAKNDKPVVIRVKRKARHSPLEGFWLEISERPLKRPFLDFQKLSISNSAAKAEEVKTKKIFVRHVDTVSSSELSSGALQAYIHKHSGDRSESKRKIEDRRHNFDTENKQNKLLIKAKQKQDALSRTARFEQIWRSRKEKKKVREDDGLHEMCNVYDVIRVDVEETSKKPQEQEDEELEDHRIMASFLPLLKEFIPSAAAEVESNIHDYVSERASKDGYVYDLYTIKGDINTEEEDALNPFPLVQVNEDDDFYEGPDESEHDSDDSNAEDNPMNEYPDEEPSEGDDMDDFGSKTTKDESEEDDDDSESESIKPSSESQNSKYHNWSREVDPLYDGDFYFDDYNENGSDDYNSDDDDDDDEEKHEMAL